MCKQRELAALPGGLLTDGRAPAIENRIICIGDSITQGVLVSELKSYPHQLAGLLGASSIGFRGSVLTPDGGAKSWKVNNFGFGGYTCQNVIDRIVPTVVLRRDPELARDLVVVFVGTNDLAAGDSGATVYAKLTTIVSTLQADGFEVWVCTAIDRNSFSVAGFDTRRVDYNALINANTAGADEVIDLYADARLQNASNATYFLGDTIHPNAAGYAVIAELIEAAI